MTLAPLVVEALRSRGSDIPVVLGGIVPPRDIDELRALGVAAVFGPGSGADEIVATITEEARQEGADLIVLGRGAMHETLGRLRTHAHGIIQRSPCPVLSV